MYDLIPVPLVTVSNERVPARNATLPDGAEDHKPSLMRLLSTRVNLLPQLASSVVADAQGRHTIQAATGAVLR
jgi:hypothetical protein